MALKKYLGVFCASCLLFTTAVFAQDAPIFATDVSGLFTLTNGSSFSASGSDVRSGRTKRSLALTKEAVTSDFKNALEAIQANHVVGHQINPVVLTDLAISSMLKSLDPHSNYYDANEFQELLGEHQSEYSGTGSSISGFIKNGLMETFVVATFPGSPAAFGSLRFGDRIVAVNGQSVSGLSPDYVRDRVRGKRGTFVKLTIERSDTKSIEIVELKRDRVHQPAVPDGHMLQPGVGYIDLTGGFSNATFGELESALNGLHRQGMRSLVLDIRGNGGGILDQAVKVAEKFLPAGDTIVSQRGRYPEDSRVWKANKPAHENMPLVLLVDENSASASEVVAGAFQDNDRALIVGGKTFGKGLVQNVLSLPNGSGLTLTAARYYTPSGRSIQRDYADIGLYDYFNHRGVTAEIEKSAYVAKTVTNRAVYGGDGITPDESLKKTRVTPTQILLLDPLFFFAREFVGGRVKGPERSLLTLNQQIRQQIVFGDPVVTDAMLNLFAEFVAGENSWKIPVALLTQERIFIKDTLRYNFALAAFGINSANRTKIDADPQVRHAIEALPKAARLAIAAQKARTGIKKQKSSLSLILNERK